MYIDINDKSAFDQALSDAGDKLVVVDFTASWCKPCSQIAPIFKEQSNLPENKNVVFLKVDVDEASDVAGVCSISSMPTFQFFKNGKKIDQFSGASAEKLIAKITEHR